MSSAATPFTKKELETLRNEVYKGYQNKPRDYGQEAMDFREYMEDPTDSPPRFRNQINYGLYGGKGYYDDDRIYTKRDGALFNMTDDDGRMENVPQAPGLFSRVAKELDIKSVDSESDLRQMFDYVLGARAMGEPDKSDSDKPEDTTTDAKPDITQPSDTLTDLRDQFDKSQASNDAGNIPRMATDGNPYSDAINYGNDMNDYFQTKFIPSVRNEAQLASQEIGETGKFYLNKFIGKVPKLGDPKELFDYYSDKIKDD